MTTATGSFALNFAALGNVSPYTDANLTYITADRGKILSSVFRWASGSNFRCAARYNGSVSGNLAAKIEFGAAGGSGDEIAALIVDSTGAGYAAVCRSTSQISLLRISALNQADVLGSSAPTLASGDVVELRLNQTTHVLTVHINGAAASITATDSTVTANLTPGFMAIADNTGNATIKSFGLDGSATAAVVSSPTPSGTLGTTTTATIGCTTNQNTGTLYYVASTNQAKITGATAAQVKAGNGSDGVALARNGSNTVSSTSPTIAATGFTAGTLYYYAVVQNNANGDSNVLTTGSFTTAVAYRSFSITLRDAAGALLNGVNLKFWTRTTKDGAAVDGGSTGLSITCGSNGIFSNSALTIAAGTYYLFWEDPSDPYKSHWMQYTFA